MRRGRHAANDGSFGRSAGMAAGRGALLLAVAVLIGVFFLNAADEAPPGQEVRAGDDSETTAPPEETSSSSSSTTSTTAPARDPKAVKVLVANAANVAKLGATFTDFLKTKGYNALAPTNAPDAPTSAVYFTQGFESEAKALAQLLGVTAANVKALPTPAPVSDTRGANVLVVVGVDLSKNPPGATTSSSTTTTAAKR